jgi:DNA polymerase-1
MTDMLFLSYFPDPFEVRTSIYCLSDGASSWFLTAEQLGRIDDSVLTYELHLLVDDLRRHGVAPPGNLVDISEALRLLSGIPKDEGGRRDANVWRNLVPHFGDPVEARRFEAIVACREERPVQQKAEQLARMGLAALVKLWGATRARLAENKELERFEEVEAPLHGVFAARQFCGIAVDEAAGANILRELADEKYSAYAAVASLLGVSPTGLHFWNIAQYLDRTDAAHLALYGNTGNLRDVFKLASSTSAFARHFVSFVDARRDEDVLKRLLSSEGRVFPAFEVFGTITGRTLVIDPFLQQLRRSSRKVITADTQKRLLYLDYAQFEPGILASLAGDRKLLAAYNDGDLYSGLSDLLFGDAGKRKLSKRIFLAYCYGMTPEGIASLVTADVDDQSAYSGAIAKFFSSFEAVHLFRTRMQEALQEKSVVGGLLGNLRRRNHSGPLTAKERRWAVNHPVQSTASLVFKEALLALSTRFGKESILLPMHDAVLMQLDDDAHFDVKVSEAETIMRQCFVRRCPEVQPRVSVGSFVSA